MSDGSLLAPLPVPIPMPSACRPALAEALEALIACAERGACPAALLRDIRVRMGEQGLLRRGEDGAA